MKKILLASLAAIAVSISTQGFACESGNCVKAAAPCEGSNCLSTKKHHHRLLKHHKASLAGEHQHSGSAPCEGNNCLKQH